MCLSREKKIKADIIKLSEESQSRLGRHYSSPGHYTRGKLIPKSPGGTKDSSPGRKPWDRKILHPMKSPVGAAEMISSPNIFLVISNRALLQKINVFFFKCSDPVMLFLVFNVLTDIPDLPWTDAEPRISCLPCKSFIFWKLFMNPF